MPRKARRVRDFRFAAELAAAAALLALLLVLALATRARATGVTNMLLGNGSNSLLTTLTAGSEGTPPNIIIGYCTTASGSGCTATVGSMTTTSIPGGYTILAIDDAEVSGSFTYWVVIDGFSASPGAGWLGGVTFNGVTYFGSAATFGYSSGTATWKWTSGSGWGFVNTDVYPGTVQY